MVVVVGAAVVVLLVVEGSFDGFKEDCQRFFSASRAAIRPLSREPICGIGGEWW